MIQPTIASREVTRYILKTFNIHMSKKLGQNFLIDADIVRGIVDAADIRPGERVLEIGPGIGTLTQGLAEAGAEVTAVELDKKIVASLRRTIDVLFGRISPENRPFRVLEGGNRTSKTKTNLTIV